MNSVAAFINLVGGISGITALIGLVLLFIKLRPEIKKTEAEAEEADKKADEASANSADIIGDAWKKLFEEYEARQLKLEERIKVLEKQLLAKNKEIADLKRENKLKDERIATLQKEVDTMSDKVAELERQRDEPS